jgi:hypothetical protein
MIGDEVVPLAGILVEVESVVVNLVEFKDLNCVAKTASKSKRLFFSQGINFKNDKILKNVYEKGNLNLKNISEVFFEN